MIRVKGTRYRRHFDFVEHIDFRLGSSLLSRPVQLLQQVGDIRGLTVFVLDESDGSSLYSF